MQRNSLLKVEKVSYEIDGNVILKDVNFEISPGVKVLLMGPNGVGKSSLVNVIIGALSNGNVSGKIFMEGKDISKLSIDKRSQMGILVGFQNPPQLPGINYLELLYFAFKNQNVDDDLSIEDFEMKVKEIIRELEISEDLLERNVNENLSGGEKKKMELLQMVVLKPKLAILDEPDSGLDADSSILVEKTIELLSDSAVLLISHNVSNLKNIKFDEVLILRCCGFLERGGENLINQITENGYGKGR